MFKEIPLLKDRRHRRDKPKEIYRPRLWAPFEGKVRMQVGYPDNPQNPGEVVDTGWESNAVLPFLPYMLWSTLSPFDSTPGTRYLDGTNVYPSWGDILASYSPSASIYWWSALGAGTLSTSPIPGGGSGSLANRLGSLLLSGLMIGNYTTAAPAGNSSFITLANLTTYSVTRSANGSPTQNAGQPTVYFGPAISSSSITGVGPPTASTTITYTFATQAGTVNCISFLPLGPTPPPAGNYAESMPLTPTNYYLAQAGSAASNVSPGSFTAALATTGNVFNTGTMLIASTFYLASSAVTIPTGGQLTMSYQLSVTL